MIKLNIQLFGGGEEPTTTPITPGHPLYDSTLPGSWVMGTHGYIWKGTGTPDYSTHPIEAYRFYGRIPSTSELQKFEEQKGKEGTPDTNDKEGYPSWRDFVATGGGDGLKHNNWGGWTRGTGDDLQIAFELYLKNGKVTPSYTQFVNAGGQANGSAWKNISDDLENIIIPAWTKEEALNTDITQNLPQEGKATKTEPVEPQYTNPREDAYRSYFNRYYDDVMTTEEGTLGKQILDNNVSLYTKEADNAAILANTGLQAQAMTQAQAVKQATDAVRSERMAQLRAGMSESQLADRELQMLMGSVNQMSQQAQMASQEATAAQLASNTARENAFNDYIAQATQLGQNAAANYASEVGDAYALAAKYMREAAANGQNITWDQAYQKATGATTS